MANIESCFLLFPDEFRSVALGVFPFEYLLRVEEFSSGSRFNHFSHHIMPRHLRKSYSELCYGSQRWLAEQEVRVLHKRQTGFLRNYKNLAYFLSRPFLSSPGPLYQNEVKRSAFDMKMIFHSHANKTCFHKKGCALGLILKVRVFGTRKSPVRILRPWDLSLNRWLISFTFN